MGTVTRLDGFRVPLGGQEIELQQVDHDAGGMSMLRIRIRERTRFTVFDVDPLTARRWGEGLTRWAEAQAQNADGQATGAEEGGAQATRKE